MVLILSDVNPWNIFSFVSLSSDRSSWYMKMLIRLLINENQIRTIICIIRSRTSSVDKLTSTIVFDRLGIISNGSSNVFWDDCKSRSLFISACEGYLEGEVCDLRLNVP